MRLRLAPVFALVFASVACGVPQAPPAKAPPAEAHPWRMASGTSEIACRGRAKVEASKLRGACEGGDAYACVAIVDAERVSEADAAFVRSKLEATCEHARAAAAKWPNDFGLGRDRTCSCAAYGSALTRDASARFDAEGLALLDEGCVRGVLDACDEAQLFSDLCAVQRQARPLCEELRRQRRVTYVPEGDPSFVAVELPPALSRCFTVVGRSEACWPAENGPPPPDSIIGMSPCAPAAPLGTTYCFDKDRYSWKLPSSRWDQRRVDWAAQKGSDRVRAFPGSFELRVASGGAMLDDAKLAAAPPTAAREAQGLPRVEDVCARSHRCTSLVTKMLPPPPTGDAPALKVPTTLLGCEAERREASKLVANPPPECR